MGRSRWSFVVFVIALCCCARTNSSWFCRTVDTRPFSISSWNPPKTSMISCPWKRHETLVHGYLVEGKICDWKKIRCDIIYESCVQTSIKISKHHEIMVACLPNEDKSMRARLTIPTTVSRRRRSLRRFSRCGCQRQKRKICVHRPNCGAASAS